MSKEIYDIPESVERIFMDLDENNGDYSYSIIDYNDGMDMDNVEAMGYFVECVGISDEYIEEDLGTQIVLKHPNYKKRVVIDSGGLGDFFSHGFDCYWQEE